MSLFQRIREMFKRINSISTPLGGFGWDNTPRVTQPPPTPGSEKPRAKSDNSTDELEMPPQANDPAIRDIVRRQLLRTYGRAPTKKEVDQMLAKTVVMSGVDHTTEQDLAEFQQIEKRRTKD